MESYRENFARVTKNDALHGSIGFQGCRIDSHCFAFEQLLLLSKRQDLDKHLIMHLQRKSSADVIQRRMIGRRLTDSNPQEPTDRKRITAAPRDATLRANAFEVTDQQYPEVNAG